MAVEVTCALCRAALPVESSYIIRIDVFADPSMPATSAQELAEMDFDRELAVLLEQMKDLSAEELMDQVHRRFEFRLCPGCQKRFLLDPLARRQRQVQPEPN